MQDDANLVAETLAGDRLAYGTLYDRYAPLVRSVCYETTGNLNDSQDLAQDVFLRAYSGLKTLREGDRFGAWLVGIARNVCRDWVRSRSRDRHRTLGTTSEVVSEETFDPAEDSLGQLYKAMAVLSEQERLALQSFYLNGQSADQARNTLGLSQSGFYKVLERARGKVASFMQREGETR